MCFDRLLAITAASHVLPELVSACFAPIQEAAGWAQKWLPDGQLCMGKSLWLLNQAVL